MYISTVYAFSSSSGTGVYQTLVFEDGRITCNCPGWTRRIVDGVRTCKHVRLVEMGLARAQCLSLRDYTNGEYCSPSSEVIPKKTREPKKPFYAKDYPPVVVSERKVAALKQGTGKPQSVCVADRNIDFSSL